MQITDFLNSYTGLTNLQLFGGKTPLVALARDGDGTVSITTWGVTTVAQPTADQIAKALAAPDPGAPVPILIAYAASTQAAVLAKGQTFNVAGSGAPAINILCDGSQGTRSDLALLALYGQANPTGSKTWIDNLGVATILSGTELVTLANEAGNWITDTYAAMAGLAGQITASSPTITTTAEIDQFAWPTS